MVQDRFHSPVPTAEPLAIQKWEWVLGWTILSTKWSHFSQWEVPSSQASPLARNSPVESSRVNWVPSETPNPRLLGHLAFHSVFLYVRPLCAYEIMEFQGWISHQQSLVKTKAKTKTKKTRTTKNKHFTILLQLPIQASCGTWEESLVLPVTWPIFASEASLASLHAV